MYGYTLEQLKRKLKVSIIIGAIASICFSVSLIFFSSSGLGISTINDTFKLVLYLIGYIIGMFLGISWAVMAYALNLKKILKGIIFPIPILSACIEVIKGQIMAIKVIIFIIKNKKKNG